MLAINDLTFSRDHFDARFLELSRLPHLKRSGGQRYAVCLPEPERWLALALLTPTAVLLALFIAYPFFEGVLLSLSSTRVGDPGHFVGLKNFEKIWDDSIFRTTVWNTFWYTGVTTVFKLALGLWLVRRSRVSGSR
jgi:ABC-type spermidine/putrescine transport system permease subunit I